MKLIKILFLNSLIYLLLTSCGFPETEYKSNDEGIKFKEFINDGIPFKCLGTEYINAEAIETKFTLEDGLSLDILKLGRNNNAQYTISKNKFNPHSGYYSGINGTYYSGKYSYDESIPTINNLSIYIDGNINSSSQINKIREYNAYFKNFYISINNDRSRIELESWSETGEKGQTVDFAFYEKGNEIYLLILTSETRTVEKNTLIKMLKP
jgi:hypothetical protein